MNTERIQAFIQLKPEEEVLEVVRENLIPHAPLFLLATALFVTPFFFLFPLFREGIPGVVGFFLLIISGILLGMLRFYRWYNTLMIITDRRIVDVERRGLFDNVVSEIPFGDIDDVSYRVKGFFPTLFRFGVFTIQRRGNVADIEFRHVKRPARIHNLVNDLRNVVKDEVKERTEEKVRRIMETLAPEELDTLVALAREQKREEALEAWSEDMEKSADESFHSVEE